jgi:hypothetical protein
MTGMAGPPPAKMVPFNSPLFSAAVPSSSNLPHLVVNRLNASTATAARGYIEKDIDHGKQSVPEARTRTRSLRVQPFSLPPHKFHRDKLVVGRHRHHRTQAHRLTD